MFYLQLTSLKNFFFAKILDLPINRRYRMQFFEYKEKQSVAGLQFTINIPEDRNNISILVLLTMVDEEYIMSGIAAAFKTMR